MSTIKETEGRAFLPLGFSACFFFVTLSYIYRKLLLVSSGLMHLRKGF